MPGANPEHAEAKAELWLKQNGFQTLPVDPHEIAARLEIEVQAKKDTDAGVSGMLLRHGDNFGILYATHVPSLGFQRFSISHELGHYLLEGHPEQLFPNGDGVHVSQAGFVSMVLHEREADHFASGLLMPDGPFRSVLRRAPEGLEGIETLAEKCVTSLTATAIRYAKKTIVPAAVIVSTNGKVDFAFLSGEMREFPGIEWIKKGDLLPASSMSSRFARGEDNVRLAKREADDVDLDVWLGGRRGLQAKEEVLGLGAYGKVLTVLTTDYLPDEADEEDELEASWKPRFKRR